MVLSFSALGARVYCRYTFPILILIYSAYAFMTNIDDTQHLILLNMLSFFMFYQMSLYEKYQQQYFYTFTNTIQDKESKLVETNEQLNNANIKLKEINFALSHDLKTPVRNIVTFSQILEMSIKDKLNEEEVEWLEYIMKSGKHIDRLIEGMLKFVNVSHDKTSELKTVDLNEIFKNLKVNYQSLIYHKQLSLSFQKEPPYIKGNYTKVYLLMQNIIDNGIKYNDSKIKNISVSHFLLDSKTCITIKDNGIGIEEQYHAQIFKPFKRLDDKENYQGSGLGLALCSEIMEQLGGTITLVSDLGKGSEFILEFPN